MRKSIFIIAAVVMFGGGSALAQSGVSDDRVSLPEAPGSLEGLGDNADIDPNMGLMTYSIGIEAPDGYVGLKPGMALSYSSSGGNGVAGMGWSIGSPSIERLTLRGLPEYDEDDEFAAGGSDQLVYISGTNPRIYRSRFESGFVRYSWFRPSEAGNDYWVTEYPDGTIGYFGAESDGTVVPSARSGPAAGTFRYRMVEKVDINGHKIHFNYGIYGTVSLLEQVSWVFVGEDPRYRITFAYEARTDKISDCKAGYEELLEDRLSTVNVISSDTKIRSYHISYENYLTSGGFSRIETISQKGRNDEDYPVVFTMGYSKALGAACESGCEQPYIVSIPTAVSAGLSSGDATLIDINGDALPDVLDTSAIDGTHKFYINEYDGVVQDFSGPVDSVLDGTSGFKLSSPYVQVLDANGDGFTDLLNAKTGEVLINEGLGDWSRLETLGGNGTDELPDFDADFDLAENDGLQTIRFMDYDMDRRIDVIRSTETATVIYKNAGNGGFATDSNVEIIGRGFETDRLKLADMNGDGLLDPVLLTAGIVSYQLNLGWGQWDDPVEITGLPFNDDEIEYVELEDINGDALDDLVVVTGVEVRYALSRNGASFHDAVSITQETAGLTIPERVDMMAVLFADMNGNGSNDIVWIDKDGHVTFLELFPVRPNLLSRIENGLGWVQEITYAPSIDMMATDDHVWPYKLPHPMTVVEKLDIWDELSKVHSITSYVYHDGYYDGVEKDFRGYTKVGISSVGDEFLEEGHAELEYDVGVTDIYHNGLQIKSTSFSADRELAVDESFFDDCDVAGVPEDQSGLLFPVRFICETGTKSTIKEGLSQDRWVVKETTSEFDGYGNRIKSSNFGVTSIAGGTCAACARDADTFGSPCGGQCLGDEAFAETEFVSLENTNGRWILNMPYRQIAYGVEDSTGYNETLTYYDGDPFVGLSQGELTLGNATRVAQKQNVNGDYIDISRSSFGDHGEVLETITPRGNLSTLTEHRELLSYDATGLLLLREDELLVDRDGTPYRHRTEFNYDAVWGKVVESTQLFLTDGDGAPLTTRASSYYAYDNFGRVTKVVKPGGDTLESPTQEMIYMEGNPVSKMHVLSRTAVGGAQDVEEIRCFDGRGRNVQILTKITDDSYQVDGFKQFGHQGNIARAYQPYTIGTPTCASVPPTDIPFNEMRMDGMFRTYEMVAPDTDVYGSASTTRIVYEPLKKTTYDGEDNDPTSPHADTPVVQHFDGLGRTTSIERYLSKDGAPVTHTLHYTELGKLKGYTDPGGATHNQVFDLLGRVLQVEDGDSGLTVFEYAEDGLVLSRTDARGSTQRFNYDGAGRVRSFWEDGNEQDTKVEFYWDFKGDCPASKCTNSAGMMVRKVSFDTGLGEGDDFFGYDVRKRLIYHIRSVDGRLFEFGTEFDNLDREIARDYPGGERFTFDFDAAGRLSKVPGVIDGVTYTRRGATDKVIGANGIATNYSFDVLNRISHIGVGPDSGASILDRSFSFDRAGNLLSSTDGLTKDGQASGNMTFGYDALYRVVSTVLEGGRTDLEETLDLAYGVNDNITSATSSLGGASPANIGAYEYNGAGPHAVSEAGGVSYSYDAAGNMTNGGDTTYEWDHQGRLTSAVRGDDTLAEYYYRDDKTRLAKSVNGHWSYYVRPDFEVRDGHGIVYIHLGGGQLFFKREVASFATEILSDVAPATLEGTSLTVQPDGMITAADAWISNGVGEGIFSPATALSSSEPAELLASSVRRMLLGKDVVDTYYHNDHNGSVVATTDENGSQTLRAEYYPYGALRYEGYGNPEDMRYTGKETDVSTGLTYFGSRYSDPKIGRWLSADSSYEAIIDPNGMSKPADASGGYSFCVNNPVNLTDPDGDEPFTITVLAITGAVVGGGVGIYTEIHKMRMYGDWGKNVKRNWAKGGWKKRGKALGYGAYYVLKVLGKGALGAVSGFGTLGASAAVKIAATYTETKVYKKLERKRIDAVNNSPFYDNIHIDIGEKVPIEKVLDIGHRSRAALLTDSHSKRNAKLAGAAVNIVGGLGITGAIDAVVSGTELGIDAITMSLDGVHTVAVDGAFHAQKAALTSVGLAVGAGIAADRENMAGQEKTQKMVHEALEQRRNNQFQMSHNPIHGH